ncbi:hypothetical protein VNI00_016968 [Paramarasmius palmivorus]|uniref:CxC2-like cysteine cluster KDZ transposase-associated domain-containing protein n=1 Tax=Paramarasmius palmivorus TaxID=297713 RepID=A0AAW0BAR8_9AGAR
MSSRSKRAPQLTTVFIPGLSKTQPIRVTAPSQDGRRTVERLVHINPPSPVKRTRLSSAIHNLSADWSQDSPLLGLGNETGDDAALAELMGEASIDSLSTNKKRATRRSVASAQPMVAWKTEFSSFLAELMALEGRAPSETNGCARCKAQGQDHYRCRICMGDRLLCKECMVEVHETRPFDMIERWNGSFFERCTLKSLDYILQLGNCPGGTCKQPRRSKSGFVVVDIDSIQEVTLQYCGCRVTSVAGTSWEQLMRSRLYPATTVEPMTAFTFRMLEFFHDLTLQGKVSVYDFYHALETRTDGAFVQGTKDRYDAFIRVQRQWRVLTMCKRGGIGNRPGSTLSDVKEGELAVTCIACPRPGVNLPDDWNTSTPLSKMFLYHKFISLDACFRLKRRDISSEIKDPGLLTGKAYYVTQEPFQTWAKTLGEQKETSSCTGLAAVDQANTKYSKGYAATGAILCICARHEMVEPNGTVDTTKGEKYGLSDYAVGASQRHSDEFLFRILSYDIACQYHKRFFERMNRLPMAARMGIHMDRWKFAVPKLHIQGHERSCQENFALHFILGAGQTDGEGIERHWANLGPIATSTREMGPGHRRDTLDDHFGAWNWAKIKRLGLLLRRKRQDAREQCLIHAAELADFTESQGEIAVQWLRIVEDYKAGKSDVNPYASVRTGITEHDVRLKYAQAEAEDMVAGVPALHDVSKSAFMMMGLEIEEQQRQLEYDLDRNDYITSIQKSDLLDRKAKIGRAIARFRGLQQVYMPLALTQPSPDIPEAPSVEKTNLYLPSSLPPSIQSHPSMTPWITMERDFREAQLQSSLDGIRTHLFVRSRLTVQRSQHVRHQKNSTRARKTLARNDRKIIGYKHKYRKAWSALISLSKGDSGVTWPELRDEDVRGLEDIDTMSIRNLRRSKVLGKRSREQSERSGDTDPPTIAQGESRRTNSWIWRDVGSSDLNEQIVEATRVEWCKTYARKRRWDEELLLVEEEMRRAVAALQHEASVWRSRVDTSSADARVEGRNAYAYRQASIREQLAHRFSALWLLPDPVRKRRKAKEVVVDTEDNSGDESVSGDDDDDEEEEEDMDD